MNDRLTITEVAKALGITPRTIMRWEKAGRIKKPKRDWRGWRFYFKEDVDEIKKFYETAYEYDDFERPLVGVPKGIIIAILTATSLFASSIFILCEPIYADSPNFAETKGVVETERTIDIVLDELPTVEHAELPMTEAVKYTLGPNDVIAIEVRRHPEFSGQYAVNSEGKIEYKYVGDVIVSGFTKVELNERLAEILGEYIMEPEINIQIVAYLSKVFYVVGEVGRPGKFYMRGDTIKVREALVQAGLPTHAAAMRRCRLVTPNDSSKDNYVGVNVYTLLYEGNLGQNLVMEPGDVLYVPATAIAKMLRVISPATSAVGQATGMATTGATVAGGL